MSVVTMRELLEAGIHFGHQTRRWCPKMAPYIFGQRNGIYIIDLQKTLRQLDKAYACVRGTVASGGLVLFVGTKKQSQEPVAREAMRCGMYYVNNRWLGGMLTNWETIRKSVGLLQRYDDMEASGAFDALSKKQAAKERKAYAKLDKNLRGIKDMDRLPEVVFVIDAKKETIAVREAGRLRIMCIGIVDTNCDPSTVTLPIPGNDDAIRAINLFCTLIGDAVLEGRALMEKAQVETAQKEKPATAPEETAAEPEVTEAGEQDTAPEETASQVEAEASAVLAEPAEGPAPEEPPGAAPAIEF